MPSTRGAKGAVKPRIKTGTTAPVTVDYQPSLISRRRAAERTDVSDRRVEPMHERDVPARLRHVDLVALALAYGLAGGNWDRVRPDPKDPRTVVVD